MIADQLVRAGVLARAAGPAERRRAGRARCSGRWSKARAPPVIVVDGLDEARGQAFPIAEELLLRLAPYATVIVSTRELRRGETEPSLLDVLTAGAAELDLDDPAAQERGAGGHARLHRRAAGRAWIRGWTPDAVAGLPGRGDVDDRGQPVPAGPAGHRPAARGAGRHLPAGLAGHRSAIRSRTRSTPTWPSRPVHRGWRQIAGRRGACWPR